MYHSNWNRRNNKVLQNMNFIKKCNISAWKGILFIVIVCLSQILLTYLTMTLFPKLKKEKNPEYYRAAVFEVVPYSNSNLSIAEVIQKNLEKYKLAASLANSQGVDIIVFPESVLFSDVDNFELNRPALIGSIAEDIPDPLQGSYNPCDQEKFSHGYTLLKNLSCMAKDNNMFVVANLVDYKHCDNPSNSSDNATTNCSDQSKCPSDGLYVYNTNVVFNRHGKLVARYHKKHLYYEKTMDSSKCPENGFFDTDFGNFTTFICFDILFKEAEQTLLEINVNNVAYTFYWFDHTPFFVFADVFHQAYSIYNEINILAANGHVPGTGTVGSGIFSASNAELMYTHQPDGIDKLLISNVPRQPKTYTLNTDELNRKRYSLQNGTFAEVGIEDDYTFKNECEYKRVGPAKNKYKDYRCNSYNLTNFSFKKLIEPEGNVKVCRESFCCFVQYKAHSMDEDYFIAVTATDFKLYKESNFNIEGCFLTRCRTEDGKSCSSFLLHSETVFESVIVKGTFINKYIYPFSLNSNVKLTPKNQWEYNVRNKIQYRNLNTNSSLLFFGLYGTDFADG